MGRREWAGCGLERVFGRERKELGGIAMGGGFDVRCLGSWEREPS